jgi:hypothetical protein
MTNAARSIIAVLAAAALGWATPAGAAGAEQASYAGFGVAVCAPTGAGVSIGGACFAVPDGAGRLAVGVADPLRQSLLAQYSFWASEPQTVGQNPSGSLEAGYFCLDASGIPIPSGARVVAVRLAVPTEDVMTCPSTPSTGTISVSFF